MTMSKWMLVTILALEAHFAASYLVPLDGGAQNEFGGLLRWFWPWSYGDTGPLGHVTEGQDLPLGGLLLALSSAALLLLAALSAAGAWVPSAWSRWLGGGGAILLLGLLSLFIGPTKVVPLVAAAATLYFALAQPDVFVSGLTHGQAEH
jgi:hypothetical protein